MPVSDALSDAKTDLLFKSDLTLDVSEIDHRPVFIKGALDAAALIEVRDRFGFLGVEGVEVALRVKRIARDCWALSGQIEAQITQACVITGVEVGEELTIALSERFVPPHLAEAGEELEIDIEADDIEWLENGAIAVGEAVLQHISVSAQPYPKAPDAPEEVTSGPVIEKVHPFAALSKLKK